MKKLNTLITIARYWPAVGGSEIHARYLAQSLSRLQDVEVLFFNGDSQCSNERCALESNERHFVDYGDGLPAQEPQYQTKQNSRGVLTHQAAVSKWCWRLLDWASSNCDGLNVGLVAHCKRYVVHSIYFFAGLIQLLKLGNRFSAFHNIYNGLTGLTVATFVVAKLLKCQFIWTPLITTQHTEGEAWSHWFFLWLYRRADQLIVLTEFEKEWLRARGIEGNKIHVIPMGPVVTEKARPQDFRDTHQLGDKPLVLFLGRLVADKGYELLLEASEKVLNRLPDCQFVFIGPAGSSALKEQYQHPNRIWLKSVDQQSKTDALAAADCLCVPSKLEGLGGVFIEAWSQGTAVIGGDIPVLQNVIAHDHDGLLVKHQKLAIADAILVLVQNRVKALKFGQNGKRKVKNIYQWPKIAWSLHCLY